MLPSNELTVKGYRCFRSLRVGGLTRVNLLVGANNSGKTALLEAIEIFAMNAAESSLYASALRRGEIINHNEMMPTSRAEYTLDLRPLFRDPPWSFSESREFSIASGGENVLVSTGGLALLVKDRRGNTGSMKLTSAEVGIRGDDLHRLPSDGRKAPAAIFLPAGDVSPAEVRRQASEVVGNRAEVLVHDLLRLVDARVERLVVTSMPRDTLGWEGIYFNVHGESERMAISLFGEGMKKATQLALALARSKGGILLVDEIDDGLHHSALQGLWRFTIEAARRSDIQVFATTHSKDCVEAIARLYEEEPSLAQEISVHRLDVGQANSADSEARAVATLIEAEMELR